MRFSSFAFVLASCAGLSSVGCARQAQVQVDALPLQRVVIYRNGVAYFERGGHVEEDRVEFRMKEAEIGDFLATLAVMEKGGSSVRAAAFPLDVNDEVSPDDPVDTKDVKKPPKSEDEKRGIKKVILSLDGHAHDLQVGYIAAAPVWRPSYRLVVHDDGRADLQAWGVVENLSGEDWTNVKLALVAGAPLAFEAQLGTPVIPPRPTVTDEGEVIAAVPRAETSLSQEPPLPPAPAPVALDLDEAPGSGAAAPSPPDNRADKKTGGAAKRRVSGGPQGSPKASADGLASYGGSPYPAAAPAMMPVARPAVPIAPPRNLRSLAAVAVEAGTTRYDLPEAVTVPDKSATMVMLLSKSVPGEAIFLFAPDGGVPDSSRNPFRVARFTNGTGGALERGPIAVFEEGSFLGQGMVDPLPDAATTTVPFALERSLAIDTERKYEQLGSRVHKIENGQLTIERDNVTQTTYRARNGSDHPAKLLVKHARTNGTRLFQPPAGTEDNVGTASALVPGTIAARATSTVVVDERATTQNVEDWFSVAADEAMKRFLADATNDRALLQKLAIAWSARKDIVERSEKRGKLAQEQQSLEQQSEETRRNLKAIEKNKSADALRSKLTARLGDMATRLDDISKQIVELDSKVAELRVQFKETVRDITYVAAAPKSA